MRSKKWISLVVMAVVAVSLVIGACVSTATDISTPANQKRAAALDAGILRTHGQGVYEIKPNGLKVLHLKGTSYERGYQYGVMLKDEIEEALNWGVALFAFQIGEGDYEKGLETLLSNAKEMAQFIPPEYKEEMRGIADGLAAQGSNLTYDDIVMWNTSNDSRMISFGEPIVAPAEVKHEPGIRHPYPAVGCSSATASGEATLDGTMIMGKNMDWFSSRGMRNNAILLVVDPTDGGCGYVAPVYAGWITCIEGMNEKGIGVGLQVSPADVETMSGLGWHFQTNLILKYADSLDDAINILTVYPRPCGNIHLVADGKTGLSVVIEHTADAIAVRYQQKGSDILWTTNHFNCYPGFMGYPADGFNMVATSSRRCMLEDISTIEKWQASLQKTQKNTVARFWRFDQLLNENYGKITVEKMIQIMSDRFDPHQKKKLAWSEDGDTICAGSDHEELVSEDVPYYKSGKRGPLHIAVHNIWCLVMVPTRGDLRVALSGPFPAQKEPFQYLNLFEELARMR